MKKNLGILFAVMALINSDAVAQDTSLEELSETVRELQGRIETLENDVKELKDAKTQEENVQKEADNVAGKTPDEVVKEVTDLIEQNEMDKARRIVHTFVDKNPTSIYCGMLLFYAGNSYFVEKDYQNAAMEYMKSFRANPKGSKSAETLFKLALCFRNLSQMEKCKSTLEKITKDYPGDFANKARNELNKLKSDENKIKSDENNELKTEVN